MNSLCLTVNKMRPHPQIWSLYRFTPWIVLFSASLILGVDWIASLLPKASYTLISLAILATMSSELSRQMIIFVWPIIQTSKIQIISSFCIMNYTPSLSKRHAWSHYYYIGLRSSVKAWKTKYSNVISCIIRCMSESLSEFIIQLCLIRGDSYQYIYI